MSTTFFEDGRLSLTHCAARCDLCGDIRPGTIQFTGPNGYVIICAECSQTIGQKACEYFDEYEKEKKAAN
jgi:hypothetical protein